MKIIPVSGEIGWDVYPQQIREALADANGDDVTFEVSSPGGYVYDGLEIFNLIKNYQGKTTAKIVGMAASMASYIPLAADRVVAESNAIYMIHNARAYTGGDQNQHIKVAKILTGMSNLLAQEYIGQTGKDKKEIKSMMDAESYFYGQEILDAGFVDEIIDVGSEESAREDIELDAMFKVESLDKKLQEQPEKFENINKIAAHLSQNDGEGRQRETDPASSGKPNHEENMTFEEFIAKFPEEAKRIQAWLEAEKARESLDIQAKHEQDLSDARQEVETGKLTKEQIKTVGVVISSDAYGASIKGAGIKVLSGEKDFSNFEDLVALADESNEKIKSLKVQGNQPPGTPAEGGIDDKTQKKAEVSASAKAIAKRFKGGE